MDPNELILPQESHTGETIALVSEEKSAPQEKILHSSQACFTFENSLSQGEKKSLVNSEHTCKKAYAAQARFIYVMKNIYVDKCTYTTTISEKEEKNLKRKKEG